MDNIIILKPRLSTEFLKRLKEADFIILQQTATEESKLSLLSTHSPLSYYKQLKSVLYCTLKNTK